MNTFIVAVSNFAVAASAAITDRREWDNVTGYSYATQKAWTGLCQSGSEQSPIEVQNDKVELGQKARLNTESTRAQGQKSKYFDYKPNSDEITTQSWTNGFRIKFTRGNLNFTNYLGKD